MITKLGKTPKGRPFVITEKDGIKHLEWCRTKHNCYIGVPLKPETDIDALFQEISKDGVMSALTHRQVCAT